MSQFDSKFDWPLSERKACISKEARELDLDKCGEQWHVVWFGPHNTTLTQTHVDDAITALLAIKFRDKAVNPVRTIVGQLELGKETGRLHIHFVITFDNNKRKPIKQFIKIFKPDALSDNLWYESIPKTRLTHVRSYVTKPGDRAPNAVPRFINVSPNDVPNWDEDLKGPAPPSAAKQAEMAEQRSKAKQDAAANIVAIKTDVKNMEHKKLLDHRDWVIATYGEVAHRNLRLREDELKALTSKSPVDGIKHLLPGRKDEYHVPWLNENYPTDLQLPSQDIKKPFRPIVKMPAVSQPQIAELLAPVQALTKQVTDLQAQVAELHTENGELRASCEDDARRITVLEYDLLKLKPPAPTS